jgi:hypothetical protein
MTLGRFDVRGLMRLPSPAAKIIACMMNASWRLYKKGFVKTGESSLHLFAPSMCMLDEFQRYCSLQRDQVPLASLLIYLKRKGGFVQLNQIWKDLGPSSGGPFWNQTTLINKLDKLERLEVVVMEKRVLPSSRAEDKKKTNTFYRLNPSSPLYSHVYGMLKIYKEESDKYSSELAEKPLDHLGNIAARSERCDPVAERELEVAMELIGEVFNVGGDEVRKMIKERMERKGLARGTGGGRKRGLKKDANADKDANSAKDARRSVRARKGTKKVEEKGDAEEETARLMPFNSAKP